MAKRSQKRKGKASSQAEGQADPKQVLEALSAAAQTGRASAIDLAEELTSVMGGAKGIALLFKEIMFHSKTQPSTKVKVLGSMMTFLERTAKTYGDQARLKMMSMEEVEMTICRLLYKHQFILPIKGVTLHVEAKG